MKSELFKTKLFNESIALSDIKPFAEEHAIYIPISVEHVDLNKYHGDARSFGYPFEHGVCTTVKFEKAMGVLADDTVVLLNETKELKRYLTKPDIESTCEFATMNDDWMNGLDRSWLDKQAKEYLDEGLITEDEVESEKADWLGNYHQWPIDWKAEYEKEKGKFQKSKQCNIEKATLVAKVDEQHLYKDIHGYFYISKYYNYGEPQRIVGSVELFLAAYGVYKERQSVIANKIKEINQNIKLLEKSYL